jgi:hypothetical protein
MSHNRLFLVFGGDRVVHPVQCACQVAELKLQVGVSGDPQ